MSHGPADQPRIYLDNAATSWPKPDSVYSAVDHYLRHLGAPAGRSGYAEAVEVSQAVENARRKIADLIALGDATHLIFTSNGTDSLNLVIHGLLQPGDHVITSVVEHNSVLRPLQDLEDSRSITLTRVGCGNSGIVDPDEVRQAIRPATRLVALAHASNVTGALQPIAEVGQLARETGVLVLCDAAQTVGHMPINMQTMNVDFLAASGHKGLMGPLGTGVLAIGPDGHRVLRSVRQGGTGTRSEQTRQPDELPGKYESGNLNVPGILGLAAAVDFIREHGQSALHDAQTALTARLLEGFNGVPGLRVRGPATAQQRVPLVSITLEGYDPQELALSLDAAHRIQVRPGLHCAPAMHEALRTHETGGTVRFSLGAFTTAAEIDATLAAVAEIANSEL